MESENIKINYIKEEEFLSYLDWLTRFKNPINNILRVSEKIITKNSISPKFSTKNAEKLSFFEKIEIAQFIWDKSLDNLLGENRLKNSKLKDFLLFEENKTFNQRILLEQIKSLEYKKEIPNKASYEEIREEIFFEIDSLVEYFEKKNIKATFLERLILKKNSNLSKRNLFYSNEKLASIKLLFIVEGITEEKLFPLFAKQKGYDFSESGIKLFAAGGKTHIVKYYTEIRNLLNIPVFILLDADGKDIINSLKSILLPKDEVYMISKGEIEDILPHELIVKTLNNFYSMEASVDKNDLNRSEPMTKILYNLYKEKGFGEFHKAKFAQILSENITDKTDVSPEIERILNLIFSKKFISA